jgi:DNA (cytosine-5)-methyltransferase 1
MAIPKNADLTADGQRQMLCDVLKDAKFPATAPDGKELASDVSELVDLVMSLGTKKHSQRPLSWTSPSPTVVSLPDDYVHPDVPRTMTVREMARFQSFPDNFEFRAKETTGSLRRRFEVPQYTQVGNAVPPKMAKAVGLVIKSALAAAANAKTRQAS